MRLAGLSVNSHDCRVLCVQGVEESSISIGLDDSVRIDLAVVGCVAVSPTGL